MKATSTTSAEKATPLQPGHDSCRDVAVAPRRSRLRRRPPAKSEEWDRHSSLSVALKPTKVPRHARTWSHMPRVNGSPASQTRPAPATTYRERKDVDTGTKVDQHQITIHYTAFSCIREARGHIMTCQMVGNTKFFRYSRSETGIQETCKIDDLYAHLHTNASRESSRSENGDTF